MQKTRYSKQTLEEIKRRVSLSEVIRPHVQKFQRRGKDYWACCPFHHEKSPSFHIREDQGYYHCFGCGAHGNAFDFVQEIRGGSFGEAVRYLADQTGVALQHIKVDPAVEKQQNDGFSALAQAADFYRQQLTGSPLGYFTGRGLTSEVIAEFKLGYAPEGWSRTKDFLTHKGYQPKLLEEAGLTVSGNKGSYDRFRDRVMFPIENLEGKVVGFGGRVLAGGEPKYLNSAETAFFNKRYVLYNLNRAREAIRKHKQAVVVEGYMDVIGLWQHGVHYAVAPLGTAITEDQVKLLWRFHDHPIICLDGDSAGRTAAVRIAKRILASLTPGKTLQFVWMPDGEDPDSYIKAEGKQAFEALLASPVSLEAVLWQDMAADKNLQEGETRAAVEAEIKNIVRDVADPLVKKHLSSSLKDRMWRDIKGGQHRPPTPPILTKRQPQDEQARILLSILYRKPALIEKFGEKLCDVVYENQQLEQIKSQFIGLFCAGGVAADGLGPHLDVVAPEREMAQLLSSPLVDRTAEHDLAALWCQIYDEFKERNRRATREKSKEMARSLLDDESGDIWQQLKAMHGQQPK